MNDISSRPKRFCTDACRQKKVHQESVLLYSTSRDPANNDRCRSKSLTDPNILELNTGRRIPNRRLVTQTKPEPVKPKTPEVVKSTMPELDFIWRVPVDSVPKLSRMKGQCRKDLNSSAPNSGVWELEFGVTDTRRFEAIPYMDSDSDEDGTKHSGMGRSVQDSSLRVQTTPTMTKTILSSRRDSMASEPTQDKLPRGTPSLMQDEKTTVLADKDSLRTEDEATEPRGRIAAKTRQPIRSFVQKTIRAFKKGRIFQQQFGFCKV